MPDSLIAWWAAAAAYCAIRPRNCHSPSAPVSSDGAALTSAAIRDGKDPIPELSDQALKRLEELNALAEMEKVSERISQASHKMAEFMYQQAPPAGSEDAGGEAADKSEDDEVIDAEYVDAEKS